MVPQISVAQCIPSEALMQTWRNLHGPMAAEKPSRPPSARRCLPVSAIDLTDCSFRGFEGAGELIHGEIVLRKTDSKASESSGIFSSI
jgi:hypothetical protein